MTALKTARLAVAKNYFIMSKKFNTADKARELMQAMEFAVDNIIREVAKPIDAELSGSQRKAELQAVKLSALDAKDLLVEIDKLQKFIVDIENGDVQEDSDFGAGFAERNAS